MSRFLAPLRLFPPLLLLACAPTSGGDPADDDDAADDDDVPVYDDPAPLAELSDGECPDLSEPGTKTFSTGGHDRTVEVLFPEDAPAGMPVLYVWHGLGDTPGNMINWLGLRQFAEENEVIVAVPTPLGSFLIEWDFSGDALEDLALYDDLRTCFVNELGADVTRVASTGFSAGGVWTTSLSMRRGDTLATIFPMSGGLVYGLEYTRPDHDFPVLLADGGPQDTWNAGIFVQNFHDSTDAFEEELLASGHFVVRCEHDGGHQPPPGARGMLAEWVLSHRYDHPSPFADGDVSSLGDFCEVPE